MNTKNTKDDPEVRTWSEKYGALVYGSAVWIILLLAALIMRCFNT